MNFACSQGAGKHELSPAEVKSLFPLLETGGLVSGIYTSADGRAGPVDLDI